VIDADWRGSLGSWPVPGTRPVVGVAVGSLSDPDAHFGNTVSKRKPGQELLISLSYFDASSPNTSYGPLHTLRNTMRVETLLLNPSMLLK
jgi:hypothetical protein